jgi:hypothetical protein
MTKYFSLKALQQNELIQLQPCILTQQHGNSAMKTLTCSCFPAKGLANEIHPYLCPLFKWFGLQK